MDRVPKMPRSPREPDSSAPTTDTDATAAAPQGKVEYFIPRTRAHRNTRKDVQYRLRWYRYTP